ncbi:O-antigen ligase family protein [Candidatus Pelagibacter sp.]|nr:O-antigen ligase family protein [Candidatus Pelagibacter sp.]
MIVSLSVQIFRPNELVWLFYISAFLLLVVLSQAFIRDMISFIYSPNTRFYGQINQLIIEGHIRSSGASRIALLLLIGYSIFIKDSIKPKYIQFIPIFFLSTIIFLYQSRAVIILLTLFILFYLLFIENWSFKGLLKYLVICFLIPYLISSYASSIKLQYDLTDKMKRDYQQRVVLDQPFFLPRYQGTLDDFEKEYKKKYIISEDNAICKIIKCKSNQRIVTTKATSGRLSDWKGIFNNFDFNNNLFFGYGSQGDRYLINQTASNGILYALSSSGIVGLIIFIIFSFIAVIKIFKYFLFNDKKNAIYNFSILIIIVIGVRSLIESSYALFGIDFIIFYICLTIVTKFDKISKQ